jgi:hypothetical protein
VVDHFIDIYSKLVIGVISFMAPVTSYLLSTYILDRYKILTRLTEQRGKTDRLIENESNELRNTGMNYVEIIQNGGKKLKAIETEISKKVKLLEFLNPKKRIGYLFSSLFLSIGILIFDVLIRGNLFNWYNHRFSMVLLIASCLFFLFAISSLGVISWKLIDAKEILAKDEQEISEERKSKPVEPDIQDIPKN